MTEVRISDIVATDSHVRFENDIQLSWFSQEERNRELLRNYIFSTSGQEGYKSSVELLRLVCEEFLYSGPTGDTNRIVIRATYGHGKSHFALVLANFFGRPFPSPELRIILDKLDRPEDRDWFKGFRENRPEPFLVIRLQGDDMRSLRQKFLAALEEALREHPAGNVLHPPFWFPAAERFFAGLDDQQRAIADEELARSFRLDLAGLLHRLEERDPSVYEICRKVGSLFTPGRVPPDFGAQVKLSEVVKWVGSQCGKDRPFPGAVIFFDEFSAFIDAYAGSLHVGDGSSLQDLLNGVSDCREKVVFVAFSQHDPNEAARNACKRTGDMAFLTSLEKDLERLPQGCRFHLSSALENVIDGYLRQDEDQWRKLTSDPGVAQHLATATDAVMQICQNRYDSDKGWGTEQVKKVLTRGCFPLHPLTVALLSSVELQQSRGGTTRGVLGFVFHELGKRRHEPAVRDDGTPNWVYPAALVDWFGEMLGEEVWRQYEETLRQTGNNVSDAQSAVLKGIFLYMAAGLSSTRTTLTFPMLMSHLTGFTPKECDEALRQLVDGGFLRKNTDGTCVFYPLGQGMWLVERWLDEQLQDDSPLTLRDLALAASNYSDFFLPQEVKTDFGDPGDWAPEHVLLTSGVFTEDRVRKLCRLTGVGNSGVERASRGYVLWALPANQQEIEWFRTQAVQIVDRLVDSTGLPVVMGVPREPQRELLLSLRKRRALDTVDYETVRKLGEQLVTQKKQEIDQELRKLLAGLVASASIVIPAPYRISADGSGASTDMETAVKHCYGLAYRRASAFFTQYGERSHNLRRAVKRVGSALAANLVGERCSAWGDAVAKDIVTQFLGDYGDRKNWGILDANRAIREPSNERVRAAWRELDTAFPRGCREVKVCDVLVRLMNPPFGYDCNKLVLLFSAWYGFHSRDLSLFVNRKAVDLGSIIEEAKNPQDLVNDLCFVGMAAISHTDPNEEEQRVDQLLRNLRGLQQELERDEAERIAEHLEAFAQKAVGNEALLRQAREWAEKLQRALEGATKYEKQVASLEEKICCAGNPGALMELLGDVERLPGRPFVKVAAKSADELREDVLNRLRSVVRSQCSRLETLNDLTEFGKKEHSLQELIFGLQDVDAELADGAKASLERLEQRRQELEREREEQVLIALLEAPLPSGLKELRAEKSWLASCKAHSDKAKQLLEQRKERVDSLIRDQESRLRALAERTAGLTDLAGLQQVRDSLLSLRPSLAGSPEAEEAEALLARLEVIRKVIEGVAEAGRRRPRSERDAREMCATLDELESQHNGALAPVQQALLSQAREQIESYVRSEIRRAEDWLDQMFTRMQSDERPSDLLNELDSPPAFLPPEKEPQLRKLREDLELRLDRDQTERVLHEFRKIRSPEERRKCLEELQKALEEVRV